MNWTPILTPLIVPVIGYLMYLLRVYVLAHVTPHQLSAMSGLAHQAVEAAQLLGKTTGIAGADKYVLASDALVASSKRLGIRLKPDEVQAFIHAALKDVKEAESFAQQNVPQVPLAAVPLP